MEEEEQIQALPEALVEKIVAMLPFPSIFKARSLSRSWFARFSAISSLEDGPERCLAASFQREAGEWSKRWESYSPVLLGTDDLIAYHQAAQSWPRLPSLSFLPQKLHLRRITWQLAGPLSYGLVMHEVRLYEVEHVIVANLLTQSWRKLPDRPNAQLTPVLCQKMAIQDGTFGAYKVILFCEQAGRPDNYCAQVYDSKSDAWSSRDFVVSSGFTDGPSVAAYLEGVVYMVGVTTPQSLLAFNVEEGTLEELSLSFEGSVLRTATMNLVVCSGSRLLVVTKGLLEGNTYLDTVQVLRVDLGSLRLVRLAQGPPLGLRLGSMPFLPPVGDGSCIFFKVEAGRSRVLEYNVDDDVWCCFPAPTSVPDRRYSWLGNSFQPGLSPFVAA